MRAVNPRPASAGGKGDPFPSRAEIAVPGPCAGSQPMKALLLVSEIEDYTISFANGLARHIPVVLGVPRRRYEHLAKWIDPRSTPACSTGRGTAASPISAFS